MAANQSQTSITYCTCSLTLFACVHCLKEKKNIFFFSWFIILIQQLVGMNSFSHTHTYSTGHAHTLSLLIVRWQWVCKLATGVYQEHCVPSVFFLKHKHAEAQKSTALRFRLFKNGFMSQNLRHLLWCPGHLRVWNVTEPLLSSAFKHYCQIIATVATCHSFYQIFSNDCLCKSSMIYCAVSSV